MNTYHLAETVVTLERFPYPHFPFFLHPSSPSLHFFFLFHHHYPFTINFHMFTSFLFSFTVIFHFFTFPSSFATTPYPSRSISIIPSSVPLSVSSLTLLPSPQPSASFTFISTSFLVTSSHPFTLHSTVATTFHFTFLTVFGIS